MSEASGVGPGPRGDDTMWDVPSQVLRRRAPGPVDMDGTVIGMVDQRPPPPAPLPRAVANRVKTGSGAVAAARLGVSTGRATPARKRPSRNEIFGYIAVGLCVAGAFGVGGTAAWMRSASRGAQHNAVAAQAESADGVSLIATALPGNGVGVAPPSAGPAPPPDFSPASAIPGAAAALPPLAGPVPLAQPADAQPGPSRSWCPLAWMPSVSPKRICPDRAAACRRLIRGRSRPVPPCRMISSRFCRTILGSKWRSALAPVLSLRPPGPRSTRLRWRWLTNRVSALSPRCPAVKAEPVRPSAPNNTPTYARTGRRGVLPFAIRRIGLSSGADQVTRFQSRLGSGLGSGLVVS